MPIVLWGWVPCGVDAALVVDVVEVEVRGGGAARRLVEFLAGVRMAMIKIRRYRVGRAWTRLSAGGRKRRTAALAAGTGTGSRGQGASSGAAGDADSRGPDDHLVDATPKRFGGGGVSSPAPR